MSPCDRCCVYHHFLKENLPLHFGNHEARHLSSHRHHGRLFLATPQINVSRVASHPECCSPILNMSTCLLSVNGLE